MKKITDIAREIATIHRAESYLEAVEAVYGTRVSHIKHKLSQSTDFFQDLWQIYSQLRTNTHFGFGRSQYEDRIIDKELYVIVSAETNLSDDANQQFINLIINEYSKYKSEIIVIGHYGALQLARYNIPYKKYFKLPVHIDSVIKEIQKYRSTTVFYQEYLSSMNQKPQKIALSTGIQQKGDTLNIIGESVIKDDYTVEPNSDDAICYLECLMIRVYIGQLILESRLVRCASQLRAVLVSGQKVEKIKDNLRLEYDHAYRDLGDEQLNKAYSIIKRPRKIAGAVIL